MGDEHISEPDEREKEPSILYDPKILMRRVVASRIRVGKLFEILEIVFETGSSK
jgi:hypothetical protein